jgi:hypothetical protein
LSRWGGKVWPIFQRSKLLPLFFGGRFPKPGNPLHSSHSPFSLLEPRNKSSLKNHNSIWWIHKESFSSHFRHSRPRFREGKLQRESS